MNWLEVANTAINVLIAIAVFLLAGRYPRITGDLKALEQDVVELVKTPDGVYAAPADGGPAGE